MNYVFTFPVLHLNLPLWQLFWCWFCSESAYYDSILSYCQPFNPLRQRTYFEFRNIYSYFYFMPFFSYIQLAKESQMVTSLELKSNTQKSRNAELEGSLEMAQENMTNIRNKVVFSQNIF